MKRRFASGIYQLNNPSKYAGKDAPKYRSSWEAYCMAFFDGHPGVLSWAYEPLEIPYEHPIDHRIAKYVPDFVVHFLLRDGSERTEMIEVKPKRETSLKEARTEKDRINVAINHAKWMAAREYCDKAGLHFRIMTEDSIFKNPSKRRK